MFLDNESETAQCVIELTREIWSTIKLVLKSDATSEEISGAAERAKFLRLYLDSYRKRQYVSLTDTELWLAQEVADAVEDLID